MLSLKAIDLPYQNTSQTFFSSKNRIFKVKNVSERALISMDISMDIHIHGKPEHHWCYQRPNIMCRRVRNTTATATATVAITAETDRHRHVSYACHMQMPCRLSHTQWTFCTNTENGKRWGRDIWPEIETLSGSQRQCCAGWSETFRGLNFT